MMMNRQENDIISRQALIRWIKTECNPYGKPTIDYKSGIKVIKHLERMPSVQPEPTYEQVMEYCKKRCLSLVANEFLAYMFSHSAQSEYTEQDVRDSFNSGYACGMEAAQPEIIRCKDCRYWVAHDKRCVYLNHGFAPNMWCCHAERKRRNEQS